MIVKDESAVIQRCLDSLRDHIDYWVIVDTGSTDGTQELVRALLSSVPGELHERPWRDFGHNRTEAIRLAAAKAEYLLLLDADEQLVCPSGFRFPPLTADQYLARLRMVGSTHSWFRSLLLKASRGWRFEGVVHEYPDCDGPYVTEQLAGFWIDSYVDGARNADPRQKFLRDAALLEQAHERDPSDARAVFYLAQSYRDASELEPALRFYQQRAAMGGWDEEVWYSLFQVALLKSQLGFSDEAILAAFLEAHANRPARAEALCALATRLRLSQRWVLAELFARAAAKIARPSDILFVDDSVYDWRAADELAIACYWTGKYRESAEGCRRLATSRLLPESERERVLKNLDFASARLEELGSSTSTSPPGVRKRRKPSRRG